MRLQPVGPLPARTYWLRRSVLLAGLILLVLVPVKACAGGDDAQSEGLNSAPMPATTPQVSAADRPAASARPTSSPVADAVAACSTRGGVRVQASADARRYPVNGAARFTLTVTNTGSLPCRIGLGQRSLELRVASGQDRIWSSNDCAPGGPVGLSTLAAGEQFQTGLTWSLTRSSPGCEGERSAVLPGTYVLAARAGELFSPQVRFQVVPADT